MSLHCRAWLKAVTYVTFFKALDEVFHKMIHQDLHLEVCVLYNHIYILILVINRNFYADFYGDFYANWKALSFAHPVVNADDGLKLRVFWCNESDDISGKHTKNYGKSPFLMGKSTNFLWQFWIAMLVYQRVYIGLVVESYPSEKW